MMQKEKEFFLQILADYLNDRVTGAQDNLDWSVLESIGEAQKLTGVIYYQCKNMIAQSDLPPLVKKKWKMGFVYNSFLYSKRLALLKQVDAAFQKENIPYFIFKGTEDMVDEYHNYWFHIKESLIGEVLALAICAIVGLVIQFIL